MSLTQKKHGAMLVKLYRLLKQEPKSVYMLLTLLLSPLVHCYIDCHKVTYLSFARSFYGHFPVEPGLAVLFSVFFSHLLLKRTFGDKIFFTDHMPFPSANQHCQGTEVSSGIDPYHRNHPVATTFQL